MKTTRVLKCFGIVVAIPAALLITGGLIYSAFLAWPKMVREKREAYDMIAIVNLARQASDQRELGHLTYPKHSLVVYSHYPHENEPTAWSQYNKFHYACPDEWLATNKTDARLVVLITGERDKLIGYTQTGGEAWTYRYWLTFVDLPSNSIVGKRSVGQSAPQELCVFTREPDCGLKEAAVVGAIRDQVTFLP